MFPERVHPKICDELLQTELERQLPRANRALKPRIRRGIIRINRLFSETKIGCQAKALEMGTRRQKEKAKGREQRGTAQIQKAQSRAQEFLVAYPSLIREAEEEKENLPQSAKKLTGGLIEGAKTISFKAGKGFGRAIDLIWNGGFYLGRLTRELTEKVIEKITEQIEAWKKNE